MSTPTDPQPDLYAPDDPNHTPYERVQMVNPNLPNSQPVTVTWLQFTIIWQLRGWELYVPPEDPPPADPPADPDPGDGTTPPDDPAEPEE